MNISKAQKCLFKCQFLSHFTRFPLNKFYCKSIEFKYSSQTLNLVSLTIEELQKQIIQMTLQKNYLYFISSINKTQLYLSEKTYVTNSGLIFLIYDFTDKNRKRLIKKDTRNFGKSIIEIHNQFCKITEEFDFYNSQILQQWKTFTIRNAENMQFNWTIMKTIQELQKLQIFKQNIALLNYVQSSMLSAVKAKNSTLNNFFFASHFQQTTSNQNDMINSYDRKGYHEVIIMIKDFLELASKSISLKLKSTEDQLKIFNICQKLIGLNEKHQMNNIKQYKHYFMFDIAYQVKNEKNYLIPPLKEKFMVQKDFVNINAKFTKFNESSVIQLQLQINLDWIIHSIDFPQFQIIYKQLILCLHQVQQLNQSDSILPKCIMDFKVQHNSSFNCIFIRRHFQLQTLKTVLHKFLYVLDQIVLLAKILHPVGQLYSEKSIKKIIDLENKILTPQKLFILKEQAKRCYLVYNQLFEMFCLSKKN